MAGAARAGIQSLFIGGGIHSKELGISLGTGYNTSSETLDGLCRRYNCSAPTYAMPFLC